MKVHFIAIGGSLMHNLAIALHKKGDVVTGSDDGVFDPSKSRLEKYGLLPAELGWFPDKITNDLDAVILGMHAHKDNPELAKANEIGVRVFSFPEYIYDQSVNKQRVVVAGSHGKTTTTSMIMHVLKYYDITFDYAVGAGLDGFEDAVSLSESSPIIIIEGDEYPASREQMVPKFHFYQHHIGVITGIAWDHANVYPDKEKYNELFEGFVLSTPKAGHLITTQEEHVKNLVNKVLTDDMDVYCHQPTIPNFNIDQGKTTLHTSDGDFILSIFGQHNLSNMTLAQKAVQQLGVTAKEFYEAISSFKGANMRLQVLKSTEEYTIIRDFAHAPSKVKATVKAVNEQFDLPLVVCLELHTYSSLNKDFIPEYKGSLDDVKETIVYFNPKTVAKKRLPSLTKEDVSLAFNKEGLRVFDDTKKKKKKKKK